MTTDELFACIRQQNDSIIALLARMAWPPEKLATVVMSRKADPQAYVRVYNALDGVKTVTELADIAKVKRPTLSVILQSWLDEGIVLNVGSDDQPKYKRLMRIPENRTTKETPKKPRKAAPQTNLADSQIAVDLDEPQANEENNGTGNQ